MRVLIVIETLGAGGGTERWMTYVPPELRRRGVEVEVAALFPPYTLGGALEASGIEVHRLGLRHRWSLAEGTLKLARLLRERRPDVVHARLYFSELYVALTRPLAPSVRRVVSFHNLAYDYPDQTLWTAGRKRLERTLLRRATDAWVAVSRPVAEHYIRHLALPGADVIHNAVPTDQITPRLGVHRGEVRERFGIAPDQFLIVVPARQVHEKGHRFLLEALVALRQRKLRPRALFLGGGPLARVTQQEIVGRGLSSQVVFENREYPHDDVLRAMAAADAVVLPSTHEGFPNAAAEALAVGVPLVASRVGGLIDLIEDDRSGLLVAPGDPMALASAVERLMADAALRSRLGAGGRERVCCAFSVDRVAEQWIDFYARAVAGAKPSPDVIRPPVGQRRTL